MSVFPNTISVKKPQKSPPKPPNKQKNPHNLQHFFKFAEYFSLAYVF